MSGSATIGAALARATADLKAAGVAGARRDARLLLEAVTGLGAAVLLAYPERDLTPADGVRFARLVARRCAREPVSRILGQREFWSLPFALNAATLDPRPDSETLVEWALALLPVDRPARLLDLGTGSGCLLLAVLSERPLVYGVGVDRDRRAVAQAAANAAALGLGARTGFVAGDWGTALAGGFDLILANPPYIAAAEIAGLAPEVREHDPLAALSDGGDGLSAYRTIAADLGRLLRPEGVAVLEIGKGQDKAVVEMLDSRGLIPAGGRRDLGGVVRCLAARKPGAGAG